MHGQQNIKIKIRFERRKL